MTSIRIVIVLVLSLKGVLCLEVIRKFLCYDNFSDIICPADRVILVRALLVMAKHKTSGCEDSETMHEEASDHCCSQSETDCGGSYSGSAYTAYYNRCNGKRQCLQLQASSVVTSEKFSHCDVRIYMSRTNYMTYDYSCVNETAISEPCSSLVVKGSAVYLWNAGYPASWVSTGSECTCSVEVSCRSHMTVTLVDLRFENTTSGSIQRLSLSDGQQSRTITYSDNNNYKLLNVFTTNSYFMNMSAMASSIQGVAHFWLEIRGHDSAEFTLSCGVHAKTHLTEANKPQCPVISDADAVGTNGTSGNRTHETSGNETTTGETFANGTNTNGTIEDGTNTGGTTENRTNTGGTTGNGTNTGGTSWNGTNTDVTTGDVNNTGGTIRNGTKTDGTIGNGTNTGGTTGNQTNTVESSVPIVIAVSAVFIVLISVGVVLFCLRERIKYHLCPDKKIHPDDNNEALYDTMPNPLLTTDMFPFVFGNAPANTRFPEKDKILSNAVTIEAKGRIENPALITPVGQPASHLPPIKLGDPLSSGKSILDSILSEHKRYKLPQLSRELLVNFHDQSELNRQQSHEQDQTIKRKRKKKKKKKITEKLKEHATNTVTSDNE